MFEGQHCGCSDLKQEAVAEERIREESGRVWRRVWDIV